MSNNIIFKLQPCHSKNTNNFKYLLYDYQMNAGFSDRNLYIFTISDNNLKKIK